MQFGASDQLSADTMSRRPSWLISVMAHGSFAPRSTVCFSNGMSAGRPAAQASKPTARIAKPNFIGPILYQRGRVPRRHLVVHRLLIAFLAAPLSAAFLQCVVLDYASGRPLSRSTITVEGVQGGQSLSRSTLRTDRAGSAYIGPLADGAYIITVARAGFATQQYGQSGWNHPGLPLM